METTPETRIALLENNHDMLMDKMEDIITRFDRFEEKLDRALEKKADVWVEKALSWLLYTVAGVIVVSFMYLILKVRI